MDTSAGKLLRSMEELSSIFSTRMAEFEKGLPQPSAKESNTTVKSIASEYSSFKNFVWKALGIIKSQVELVISNVDRLETHSRRKVLLFHGLSEEKDEDIERKILEVLNGQMQLHSLSADSLESCHRLGLRKEKVRPVLVRFVSMPDRVQVWKTKTALKGSKVAISEFLTKIRQEIFVAARSHFGVKKCWSMEGSVVVLLPDKSRRKIGSLSELQNLIAQHPSHSKVYWVGPIAGGVGAALLYVHGFSAPAQEPPRYRAVAGDEKELKRMDGGKGEDLA